MRTTVRNNLYSALGLLLSGPAVYFIFISIMKYWFGSNYLFDAAQPALERMGIKESLGWNINLLILFGPVLALLLNLFSVLKISFQFTKEKIDCHLSVRKSWWNLAVVIISGGALLVLFAYLLGENCR